MKAPLDVLEVYLGPGEFYFGEDRTRIATVHGPFVVMTMWHPVLHLGGMSHYLHVDAPSRAGGEFDPRCGRDAMRMFLREIRLTRTHPSEYQTHIFLGSRRQRLVGLDLWTGESWQRPAPRPTARRAAVN